MQRGEAICAPSGVSEPIPSDTPNEPAFEVAAGDRPISTQTVAECFLYTKINGIGTIPSVPLY
jgi:hypothetical protein